MSNKRYKLYKFVFELVFTGFTFLLFKGFKAPTWAALGFAFVIIELWSQKNDL